MASGEILINQLFAGRYLSEGGNIGHEVINLFESDSGERYLYVTPSGVVRGRDVKSVIFVRNMQARRTVEVIAYATDLAPVRPEETAGVTYGGVMLEQIFRGNTYHGGEDVFSNNVTYRAGKVMVPAGDVRILLSVDGGFDLSGWPGSVRLSTDKKVVIPQGMRSYFSQECDPKAYRQLNALMADDGLWAPAETTGKLVADGSAAAQARTFLEIIGKEDDELVFSNLLAYYFDYSRTAFRDFATEESLLGLSDMSPDFSIVRESYFNIDLWIESDERVIVIENKIGSGINGLDGTGTSQLDKYHKEAEAYAAEHGKAASFFVFAPDYSSVDFAKHDPDGIYKVIPYSSIFSFFCRNSATFIADRYFPEFLRGLERQSMTMSELNFTTMKSRFMSKIAQAQ